MRPTVTRSPIGTTHSTSFSIRWTSLGFQKSCIVPVGTFVCCLSGGPTVETVGYYRVSQGDKKRDRRNVDLVGMDRELTKIGDVGLFLPPRFNNDRVCNKIAQSLSVIRQRDTQNARGPANKIAAVEEEHDLAGEDASKSAGP